VHHELTIQNYQRDALNIIYSPYSCISTRHYDSYREWRYHTLLMYNYVLLKMSTWCSKHVEES